MTVIIGSHSRHKSHNDRPPRPRPRWLKGSVVRKCILEAGAWLLLATGVNMKILGRFWTITLDGERPNSKDHASSARRTIECHTVEGIKGWGGSERRAKPQRHVVKDLGCCLTVCVTERERGRGREINEPKDRLGAHKGLMINWPHTARLLPV
jgi:hypothetical protein